MTLVLQKKGLVFMVANNELLLYLSGIEWGLEFSKGLLGLT